MTKATSDLHTALRHYMSDGVQCQIDRDPYAQRAYSALFDAMQKYEIAKWHERQKRNK